eukprot:3919334-Amphidinium_carterae.1
MQLNHMAKCAVPSLLIHLIQCVDTVTNCRCCCCCCSSLMALGLNWYCIPVSYTHLRAHETEADL